MDLQKEIGKLNFQKSNLKSFNKYDNSQKEKIPSKKVFKDSINFGNKKRNWKTEFNSNYKNYKDIMKPITPYDNKNKNSELKNLFSTKNKGKHYTDYQINFTKKKAQNLEPANMDKYTKYNILKNDFKNMQSTYRTDFKLNII